MDVSIFLLIFSEIMDVSIFLLIFSEMDFKDVMTYYEHGNVGCSQVDQMSL
jgi:hypothetical protein